MNMSGLSSTLRVTIRSVAGSGVECGTPGIAPRDPLAEVDDPDVAVELADPDPDADGLGDAGLDAEAGGADGDDTADAIADAADGADAVPPTLAQDVNNTVVTAIEASGIARRRTT